MQIHHLKTTHKLKTKKRIGRGGKRGTTAGRGQKGQKSRAGHRIKQPIIELVKKFPKLKGLKNKSKQKKETLILHTSDLQKLQSKGILNKTILKSKNLIKDYGTNVKILFDKPIDFPIKIEGLQMSKKVKEELEKLNSKKENKNK